MLELKMKSCLHTLISIFLFAYLMSITSCSTSNPTISKDQPNSDPVVLADILFKEPKLSVQESGSTYTIRVRKLGQSTYDLDDPLYVVDGVRRGTNYDYVNSIIDVTDVDHVRVIYSDLDLVSYGTEGLNGVIEIRLK